MCVFFPAYHGHGRADGAGSEDKRSSLRDKRANITRIGAQDYTAMTNASNDARSVAINMLSINRAETAYRSKKELETDKAIRKWDQVSRSCTHDRI